MLRKELGKRLKQLRISNGLSQDDLASLLGYKDHSTLAKVETGVNDITVETLYKYAEALNVSVNDILSDNFIIKDNKNINNKKYNILVFGIGYVGLSNAILLAKSHRVTIVDIKKEKVDLLKQKISPINDKDISFYLKNKKLDLII